MIRIVVMGAGGLLVLGGVTLGGWMPRPRRRGPPGGGDDWE